MRRADSRRVTAAGPFSRASSAAVLINVARRFPWWYTRLSSADVTVPMLTAFTSPVMLTVFTSSGGSDDSCGGQTANSGGRPRRGGLPDRDAHQQAASAAAVGAGFRGDAAHAARALVPARVGSAPRGDVPVRPDHPA